MVLCSPVVGARDKVDGEMNDAFLVNRNTDAGDELTVLIDTDGPGIAWTIPAARPT
jgi:hypothetical protein